MFPPFEDICLPLLLEIAERGGETQPSACREGRNIFDALAVRFKLTDEERNDVLPSPHNDENRWEAMVREVARNLGGYIDSQEWRVWKLPEKGWEAVNSKKFPIRIREETKRVLCGDGCCIGTINVKGVCNVCGESIGETRARGRTQEEDLPDSYTTKARRKWDIGDIVGGVTKGVVYSIFGLISLGIILFLVVTFLRVVWKFLKWAWE